MSVLAGFDYWARPDDSHWIIGQHGRSPGYLLICWHRAGCDIVTWTRLVKPGALPTLHRLGCLLNTRLLGLDEPRGR